MTLSSPYFCKKIVSLSGIYLFMAEDGAFPPKKKDIHLDLACNYTSPAMNVFAYRTHAHNYATLVSNKLYKSVVNGMSDCRRFTVNLRQTYRQTDIQTDRQTYLQTDRN